jgi:hypothetical protein
VELVLRENVQVYNLLAAVLYLLLCLKCERYEAQIVQVNVLGSRRHQICKGAVRSEGYGKTKDYPLNMVVQDN